MKINMRVLCILTTAGLALGVSVPAAATASLGGYNVKLDETSVSGISSGAYMAVQVGVAHSSIVKGVGAVAGGPYYCAQNSVNTAYRNCMVGYPVFPVAAPLVSAATSWATSGHIDATSNLATQKVWLFNGYNDGVVKKGVSDALFDFQTAFNNAANVFYKDNLPAAHSQVADSYGQACDATGGNFMNNCGYDAAGQILQHIYGKLNPRNTGALSGAIQEFSQSEFHSGDTWSIGMSHYGFAYVPATCAALQPCTVHVAFHGCKQHATAIGSDYYANAGYNQWADSNNLIILYPQTVATTVTPLNPNGCWDWWGYTDSNYAKKSGKQIGVVRAMLDRLASGYTGWSGAPGGSFGAPAGVSAADSTATRIALHWQGVAGAMSYNVYRANCATCAFGKVNAAPVKGNSYADAGLSASTSYRYTVRAVNASGVESADSAIASRATTAPPPACDPYFRSNYDHWYEDRAYTDLWNINIYAYGSNVWLGYTGPSSKTVETFLRKTGLGYYRKGTCS
jgi:poly(3-hydroxybutyrate) depolymerase